MSNYDEEKEIIEALKNKDNGSQSMRVVGRGTLVMSAKDAKSSQKYKNLLKTLNKFNEEDKYMRDITQTLQNQFDKDIIFEQFLKKLLSEEQIIIRDIVSRLGTYVSPSLDTNEIDNLVVNHVHNLVRDVVDYYSDVVLNTGKINE